MNPEMDFYVAGLVGQNLDKLDRLCRYRGFFQVRNDWVPPHTIAAAMAAAGQFFRLPIDEKMANPATIDNHFLGYRPLGSEGSIRQDQQEHCEQYKLGYYTDAQGRHRRTSKLEVSSQTDCASAVESYWEAISRVALRVQRALAVNLGYRHDYFESSMECPMHQLGLNYYPGKNKGEIESTSAMSAHRDLCLFTIIFQERTGLEVCSDGGLWSGIPVVPNSFTVLLGEYLSTISDSRYMAPLHRVRQSSADRYSLIFKQRLGHEAEYSLPDGRTYQPALEYDRKIKKIMGYASA